jgi:serine/threonine protein kinase
VSSFLYRGRFSDSENTFDTIEEPNYVVPLHSDADVGVLQSKEWFGWENESSPALAGTSLIFRIQSQVSFKDRTAYRNVSVSGDIFIKNQMTAPWTLVSHFGLSKAVCGTTGYLAPEILLDEHGYSKIVDFWSLGVLRVIR